MSNAVTGLGRPTTPDAKDDVQAVVPAHELQEVYSMPGFTLADCRPQDEGNDEVDFEEEEASDGEPEAEEAAGDGNSVVEETISDGESEAELGTAAISTKPRSKSGRKRSRPKNKEVVKKRAADKRRMTEERASAHTLLISKKPKEKVRMRTMIACEELEGPPLHGGTGGYIGRRISAKKVPPDLDELLLSGYRLVKAGLHPVVVTDSEERVVAVRVGRPDSIGTTVLDKINPILERIATLHSLNTASAADCPRGDFTWMQFGCYHGTGSRAPHLLNVNGKARRAALKGLLESEGMRSLLNHVRASLMTWFPEVAINLAKEHDLITSKLPAHNTNPHLYNSPFTTTTLNLGPRTVTRPHRDAGNLQSGLCAVFLPGTHKAEHGANLVLDEAKIVMEMGAGDLAIFPSALLTHWNTSLNPDATRQSIVFWTSGQSVRYYAMGEKLMKNLNKDEKEIEAKRAAEYWRTGVRQFSTLSQLVDRST